MNYHETSHLSMESEFPLNDNIVHLNHAGVAPWPKRTIEIIHRFATENMHRGSQGYKQWLKIEQALREQLRELINAPSTDDIALLKSTSEALSTIAFGIPWKRGENIIIGRQEFPSNRIVWQALEQRYGVKVHMVDLDSTPVAEDAVLERIDHRTRLVALSSVQYASGLRMDLERVGAFCRDHDVLFCVDAIQSLGAEPFDAQRIHADFVVADGHKWMLGPEGVALFYCAAQHRNGLRLHQYGWHMVQNRDDFQSLDWRPATDARRFECGSANNLGIHALHASLGLLLEYTIGEVHERLCANVQYLIDGLDALGLDLITPRPRPRRAGIVTFRHPEKHSHEIYRQLQQQGVLCAPRAGGIRFSPHFYTPRFAMDRALNLLENILV